MNLHTFSKLVCLLCFAWAAVVSAQSEDPYQMAMKAYQSRDYQKALQTFKQACEEIPDKQDACLFWMASSSFKLGDFDRAQAYVSTFYENFPKSRWLEDIRALEAEILAAGNKPPSTESLLESSPDIMVMYASRFKAEDMLPILETLLADSSRPRFREQALFALTQYRHPKARTLLQQFASDEQGQLSHLAIQYLALSGDPQNLAFLKTMFNESGDSDTQKELLSAFMLANDDVMLERIGRSHEDSDVAQAAISLLGAMGRAKTLRRLYEADLDQKRTQATIQGLGIAQDSAYLQRILETTNDEDIRKMTITQFGIFNDCQALQNIYESADSDAVRLACLEAYLIAGSCKGLEKVALTETNPKLKEKAIVLMGAHHQKFGASLLQIYEEDERTIIRDAVIQALFIEQNDEGLIQIIETESQRELKIKAIQMLGLIGSETAKNYLKELISPQ